MIGQNSGLAGIAYWINSNYMLEGEEAVAKQDPLVVELKAWIDAQYAAGRVASMSIQELETKIEALTDGRLTKV